MKRKILILTIIIAALFIFSGAVFPQTETGEKIKETVINLSPAPDAPDASGVFTLKCDLKETAHLIRVDLKGLKPKSLYSIRFVDKSGKTTGAGYAPYEIFTDGSGEAIYLSPSKFCPRKKCAQIEVFYHPDGNSSNLKDAKVVLKASAAKLK